MLLLGSLDFALPTNNVLVTHIFCIFRPSWLMLTSSHGHLPPPSLGRRYLLAIGYLVVYVRSLSSLLTHTSFRLSDHILLLDPTVPAENSYARQGMSKTEVECTGLIDRTPKVPAEDLRI